MRGWLRHYVAQHRCVSVDDSLTWRLETVRLLDGDPDGTVSRGESSPDTGKLNSARILAAAGAGDGAAWERIVGVRRASRTQRTRISSTLPMASRTTPMLALAIALPRSRHRCRHRPDDRECRVRFKVANVQRKDRGRREIETDIKVEIVRFDFAYRVAIAPGRWHPAAASKLEDDSHRLLDAAPDEPHVRRPGGGEADDHADLHEEPVDGRVGVQVRRRGRTRSASGPSSRTARPRKPSARGCRPWPRL